MANMRLTVLLLQLLAQAAGVRFSLTNDVMDVQRTTQSAKEGKCSADIAFPSGEESLQDYFDGLRVKAGLLEPSAGWGGLGEPAKCTKKDVCLLMRQLDMDFYQRARQGTLTDHDYENPPRPFWLQYANCHANDKGYRTLPIMDKAVCAAYARVAEDAVSIVTRDDMPTGCVVHDSRETTKGIPGTLKVFLNQATTGVEVRAIREELPKREGTTIPADTLKVDVKQLCIMDRSLSEAGAVYYSPYKLKRNVDPSHSTSCSFGMMAFLSKLRETKSNCAKILTYQPHAGCHGMQDCLDKAAAANQTGKTAEAESLRKLVEQVRQKMVLIDTISNKWCPQVWRDALQKDAVCLASRMESWTEEGIQKSSVNESIAKAPSRARSSGGQQPRGRLAAAMEVRGEKWDTVGNRETLSEVTKALHALLALDDNAALFLVSPDAPRSGKPPKFALVESSCDAFEDESFESFLSSAPVRPPDWYQNAFIDED